MNTRTNFNNISYLVDRYVPSFIQKNYEKFYNFIQDFYGYTEQSGTYNTWNVVKNIQEWNDVDYTISELTDYFKKQFINLPVDNWDFYIKHHKEICSAKGTSKSLKFFIKLLTGSSAEIFYPNRYLMKSSDGVYRSYTVMFVSKNNNIDYNSYLYTSILGLQSGATAAIENIEIYDSYVKIYLSNVEGTFLISEEIQLKLNDVIYKSVIYNTIGSINIINGGNNYAVGDSIKISGYDNFLAKVSEINDGSLDSIDIIDAGINYQANDYLTFECDSTKEYYALPKVQIQTVGTSGEILSIKVLYKGYGLLSVPTVVGTLSGLGSGATFETTSLNAGSIKDVQILKNDSQYTSPLSVVITSTNGINAELTTNITSTQLETAYYYKEGSFVSDDFKLQDSYYWQEYSYVLNINESTLNKYKNIFEILLHPAGFAYFVNTILYNYITCYNTYINSILEIYTSTGEPVDLETYIETLQYSDRVLNDNIIYTYKNDILSTLATRQIDSFQRVGGTFINSSIEIITE